MPLGPRRQLVVGLVLIGVFLACLPLLASFLASGPNSPVGVLSFQSVPPSTPSAPTIALSVENVGSHPIVQLSAYVDRWSQNQISFRYVTEELPLAPGASTAAQATLTGWNFTCGATYPIVFDGEYSGGEGFSVTLNAAISCNTAAALGGGSLPTEI